jgi:hypothetical protein
LYLPHRYYYCYFYFIFILFFCCWAESQAVTKTDNAAVQMCLMMDAFPVLLISKRYSPECRTVRHALDIVMHGLPLDTHGSFKVPLVLLHVYCGVWSSG